MLLAEHGGTITAERGVEVILIPEGIIHTGQIADIRVQGVGRSADIHRTRAAEVPDTEVGVAQTGEILTGHAVTLALVGVAGIDKRGVDVMIADFPVIGKDVVDDPGSIDGMGDASVRLVEEFVEFGRGIAGLAERHVHPVGLVREVTDDGLAAGEVAGQAIAETLHPGNLDVQVAAEGSAVSAGLIVAAVIDVPKRVHRVEFLSVDVFAHAAVGEFRLAPRRGTGGRIVGTDTVVLGLGIIEVHAEADVIRHRGVDAAGDGLADELIALDEADIVVEGSADHVIHPVGCAGNIQGVLLLDTGLGDILDPVRLLAGIVIGKFQFAEEGGGSGIQVVAVVQEFEILVTVTVIRVVVLLGQTHVRAEIDHRLTLLALLGGDHDHAVGGLGTVSSQGGGILHDTHGLDHVRVDVVEATLEDDTVQHDERHAAASDRLLAADLDGGRGAGHT